MILLDGRCNDAGYADAVAPHDHGLGFAVFIKESSFHLFGILHTELEDVADLNALGEFDFTGTFRTGIGRFDDAEISKLFNGAIAAKGKMANMGVALVGSGDPIGVDTEFLIGVDGHFRVQASGTGESDRGIGQLFYQCFIGHFNIIAANEVAELDVIEFTVTANQCCHRIAIHDKEQGLDELGSRDGQKIADFLHRVLARCFHFFQCRDRVVVAVAQPFGLRHFGLFKVGRKFTGLTGRDGVFTGFGQHHEFVREVAADGTGVSLHGLETEADTGKGFFVRLKHGPVGLLGTLFVLVKGVGVFHDELTAAHQTETGADFITEFRLYLVQIDRQLLVGLDFAANEISDDFFVRGAEAVIATMAVINAKEFLAVVIPAAGFTPQVSGLNHGHEHFHGTGAVHFLTYDLSHLVDGAQAERQVVVNTAGELADHARAHQQFV